MEAEPERDFLDIKLLADLFSECCKENDVLLKEYCDAYTEVSKLLGYFGKLFYFVNRDVNQKLKILYEYNAADSVSYKSVKTMADYEYGFGVTGSAKSKNTTGCRTILRLHRALLFVIELMTSICNASEDVALRTMTKEAYENYLADYHPWAVRKAVDLAVYALPSREELVDHIVEGQPKSSQYKDRETCKQGMLNHVIPEMRKVYNCVQSELAQRNMLQLP